MPESSDPPSRPSGAGLNRQGESRSASAPVPGRKPPKGPRAQGRFPTGTKHRARLNSSTNIKSSSHKVSSDPRNVKHLTCYYWKTGSCSKSPEECAYAHHDTGMYTDKPLTLFPGGPAMAGRNLIRAQQTLRLQSSDSTSTTTVTPRSQSQPEAPVTTISNDDLHFAKVQTRLAEKQALEKALAASLDQHAALQKRSQQLELERDQYHEEVYSLRTVRQQNTFLQNQINLFLTKQDINDNWLNPRPFGLSSPWGAIGSERNSRASTGVSNSPSTGLRTIPTVTTQSSPEPQPSDGKPCFYPEPTGAETGAAWTTRREEAGRKYLTKSCKMLAMADEDEFLPNYLRDRRDS
ncbi:uncharacterized protein A1O9_02027 [Exophiala aquamarina CBS 119918]|uniref:C3H1-type domain-containing protein n=1 Tax=Exophiala aquamarina CBS 119918 TaxID=1182545 RepID=A0A072PKQ9_9EURO|nr:uncharacterized protein A1O9_02027 [Exophiala aquamarina CBS 119918]KEF60466.1 hypothetical protein A1O9_02027 [Exophiala aquamarina CBS 119918]